MSNKLAFNPLSGKLESVADLAPVNAAIDAVDSRVDSANQSITNIETFLDSANINNAQRTFNGQTVLPDLLIGNYAYTDTGFGNIPSGDTFPWREDQTVQIADQTVDSTLVYVGTLGMVFAGGFGMLLYLKEITEVKGAPAAGQTESNNWTLSYPNSVQAQLVALQNQVNAGGGGGGASVTVTYQTTSATFPEFPATGDQLLVTTDGTKNGGLKEAWIYSATGWYQLSGTTPVSGAVIDNTIADPLTISVVGRYIVPAVDTLDVFIGQENNYADFDGQLFTFTEPNNNDIVLINTGTNANQKWKFVAGAGWEVVPSATGLLVFNWTLADAYTAGQLVIYGNNIFQANSNIPANTPFVQGTTGSTFKLLGATYASFVSLDPIFISNMGLF